VDATVHEGSRFVEGSLSGGNCDVLYEDPYRMKHAKFENDFKLLTGHEPFPWQTVLYDRFTSNRDDNIPEIATLPTGLGKTSVIAVWLLALAACPEKMPRRLVYVVNRRTVVDQSTAEVQRLRENSPKLNQKSLKRLAISTLRGQFADNQEWSVDPSFPAVICGTVDMIGSRLLFSGYRIGFKSRPLHAGFLGQDALLIHDEAHLEPAFQNLIETIQKVQKKERAQNCELPWPGLRVMALSATARTSSDNGDESFGLSKSDLKHPIVIKRVNATKKLQLHPCENEKKELAADVIELALQHRSSGNAIIIFLRSVEDAITTLANLEEELPGHVAPLTGTMRGFERDRLVRDNPVFARFMPDADRHEKLTPTEGTVYLVCTSAGEVGVNLSADHLVCDLSTFDSMAQRLGRVNRFGTRDDTRVDVVYPHKIEDKNERVKCARELTLRLMRKLNGDASPRALGELTTAERVAAFAPEPNILAATDILFDAWALTSIKGKMPGRPPVAPYLHGVAEWEPNRTSVAWRNEVEHITGDIINRESKDFPQELLADYPLKPHELLRDRTDRILKTLQKLASKSADSPVWLIDDQQQVSVSTLRKLANPKATKSQEKRRLERALAENTILLPPSIGGLSAGLFDGGTGYVHDVADNWLDETDEPRRKREFSVVAQPNDGSRGMALIRTIDLNPFAEESVPMESGNGDQTESQRNRFWHWYVKPRDFEDVTRASVRPITWRHHTCDVVARAKQIVNDLNLPDNLKLAVILAAETHDLGKQREIWQRSIGNPDPTDWHAKPGKPLDGPRWKQRHLSDYRHEFGSILDLCHSNCEHTAKLTEIGEEMRDVVLHLIAAHHGYARPSFPTHAYDHERYDTQQNEQASHEVMSRYARLQCRYGRWGFAYLESLLRAADWAASASPSEPATGIGGNI
jgi:CRISPR-associated endonuclease/helicase Cas3